MKRIACISQKGGVGKTTLARDIAVQFASNGWKVGIADLDARQTTASLWNETRRAAGIEPEINVMGFENVDAAIKMNGHDLMVYDGKPYSDADTKKVAQVSDLILMATSVIRDDIHPQILLAHELVGVGIDPAKILLVINSVTSELDGADVREAKEYITAAGFKVAQAVLPRRTAYGQAHNAGRAISELVYHPSLRAHPDRLAREVFAALIPKGH